MTIITVDTGGGGDYTSLNAAIESLPTTLTDDYTIYWEASTGIDDTTPVDISINDMAGYTISIEAKSGHRASKSGHVTGLKGSASIGMIRVQNEGIAIDGLEIHNTASSTSADCVRFDETLNNTLKNCRLVSPDIANGTTISGSSGSLVIENCIFECTGVQGGASEGIYILSSAVTAYNCIVRNYNDGIERDGGTLTVVNCAVFDNVTDFDGTMTIENCCSDDGTGTNPQTPSGNDWSNEFVDYANGDFTAIETGNIQYGVGPDSDSGVPTTDIEGDTRSGASAFIGVDEPASESMSPDSMTLGSLTLGVTSESDNSQTFTYTEIETGFSGYFDLITGTNERRFYSNALWSGTITGTDASLKCDSSGTTPYVVIVDGVVSIPTLSAGEIILFSGLEDIEHNVQFFPPLAFVGSGNRIDTTETEILTVYGNSPSIKTLPTSYITDTSFLGISTESTIAAPGGNYTPTYDQSAPYDRERGQIIFNAQIDEIWIYTSDLGAWYSIDGGDPVQVLFSETNEFQGQTLRRLVNVATGLDNTQDHEYRVWYDTRTLYGTQGLLVKSDGIGVALSSISSKKTVTQFGDSITYGSAGGSSEGQADAYLYGNQLDFAVVKAGKNGETTSGLTSELSSIISASGVSDWAVLAIGRNDYTNTESFEADYLACITELQNQGISKIICRGITPNDTEDSRIITMNSQIEAIVTTLDDPNVYYVDPTLWTPIDTLDDVHPTAIGYQQLTAFETPEFDAIINASMSPVGLVIGAVTLGTTNTRLHPDGISFTGLILGETTANLPMSPDPFVIGFLKLGTTRITADYVGMVSIVYSEVSKPKIICTGGIE